MPLPLPDCQSVQSVPPFKKHSAGPNVTPHIKSKKRDIKPTNQWAFSCSESNVKALKKSCEICSKLAIEASERCQWRCSSIFITFEKISLFGLVIPLLRRQISNGTVPISQLKIK